MRVLVTGGAGFIGSHVVDGLRAAGHEAVVLDALLPQAHAGAVPRWCDGYDLVVGDVGDPDVVARALDGVDACATRRRWWDTAWIPATPPGMPSTTTAPPRCCWP